MNPQASDFPLQRLALSIDDAAALTGLGRSTIKRLIAEERLAVVRIGRRVLIPRPALEALLTNA